MFEIRYLFLIKSLSKLSGLSFLNRDLKNADFFWKGDSLLSSSENSLPKEVLLRFDLIAIWLFLIRTSHFWRFSRSIPLIWTESDFVESWSSLFYLCLQPGIGVIGGKLKFLCESNLVALHPTGVNSRTTKEVSKNPRLIFGFGYGIPITSDCCIREA